MFLDKTIAIELDERYFSKLDLAKAVILKLEREGKKCELINPDVIIINGEKYSVKERNYANPVPVQQILLTKIK